MVGVAGKSNGCNTCRRRKIKVIAFRLHLEPRRRKVLIPSKCDATKPTCLRCQRSKLQCEGYERFPVFIDRTQEGFRKRARLEEAKASFPVTATVLPSPDTEASALIAWFWGSFAIFPPSKHALLSPSHWLDNFLSGYSTQSALSSALMAVSLTKLSRATDRPDILLQGRMLKGEALARVRKSLDDPNLSMRDDLLASIGVLGLCELLDPTSANFDTWQEHLSGMSRLIQYRGPESLANPAGRAVFEHCRYLIMMQHLLIRRACVFGQPEWLHDPWLNIEKNVEQQVFDHGLQLTILFERCDAAVENGLEICEAVKLFDECLELYQSLKTIHDKHIAPSVVFSSGPSSNQTPGQSPVKTPAALMLSIKSLGIQLGACISAHDIFHRFIEPAASALDIDDNEKTMILEMAQKREDAASNRKSLAKNILLSVCYCVHESIGTVGVVRMMFALQLAVQQFEPGDYDFEQCQSMLNHLKERTPKFGAVMLNPAATGIILRDTKKLIEDNTVEIKYKWMQMSDSHASIRPSMCVVEQEYESRWRNECENSFLDSFQVRMVINKWL